MFMKKKIKQEKLKAVQRFFNREEPLSICDSLGRSRSWPYKWITRYATDDSLWFEDQSRRPLSSPNRTPAEIERIVELVRLNLYNKDLFCGNQAIQWEMEDMEVQPIPSLRTISRILCRRDLTHRRTGRYEPTGKAIPVLPVFLPTR